MSSLEAKTKYDALIKAAKHWEMLGQPNQKVGPTFWTRASESTRTAVICSSSGALPTPDYFETRKLPLSEVQAMQKAYAEFEQAIWRRAAEILREEAVGLKDKLKRERDELTELVKALEGETT